MTTWPDDITQDYRAAAIRLTTLTAYGAQHLLFASIELYPHEIPLPPATVERQRKNFGDITLSVGVAVAPIAEALAWYESALTGDLKVAGLNRDVPIATLQLSPEPALGRLLIPNDVPFAARWHAGPRIHRLVPLDEYPAEIGHLSFGEREERQIKLRSWLADRLGFDLLAYDDFLCSLVLLAPNPVVRGLTTYIKEVRPDGSERLRVKASVRQGISATTLRVRLQESRLGGTTILESRLDKFGMAEFILPDQCERSGLELVCDSRGVLTIEAPAHFFRNVHVTSRWVESQGHVEVPARRKGAPPARYPLQTVRPELRSRPISSSTMSGALRLGVLQMRRLARTGHRRPEGFLESPEDDECIFLNDRPAAVSFIHRIVCRAQKKVIFVDPYFDQIDVREFALLTQYEGVSVSVLTGRGDNLWNEAVAPDGSAAFAGDIFAADLIALDTDLRTVRRELPDVRLMGDGARVYHDRFLIVDDLVWHFGHSFNKVGYHEVSMAVRLQHPEGIRGLICEDVDRGLPFLSTWPLLKMHRQTIAGAGK
jgi:hypothetical protein